MDKIPLYGRVENGIFASRQLLDRNFPRFNGRMVKVTLEEAKKTRSSDQNAYYFGVVIPAVKAFFLENGSIVSPEYIHRFLKGNVGGMKKLVNNPDGTKGWDIDTSTKLTTAEWEDWMTAIRAWAAQFGLSIPMPGE